MKFFNLSVLALAGLVASKEASYPQEASYPEEPVPPFFNYGISMFKEFIEKSAPVVSMVSEAMGGPAFEGTDAIAAINGVTPMLNTFADAATPFADYFGFGSSENKDDDDDKDKKDKKHKAKHEAKEREEDE